MDLADDMNPIPGGSITTTTTTTTTVTTTTMAPVMGEAKFKECLFCFFAFLVSIVHSLSKSCLVFWKN